MWMEWGFFGGVLGFVPHPNLRKLKKLSVKNVLALNKVLTLIYWFINKRILSNKSLTIMPFFFFFLTKSPAFACNQTANCTASLSSKFCANKAPITPVKQSPIPALAIPAFP